MFIQALIWEDAELTELKKAFVFDTNFILQNKRLDEVIKNLKENYTVYVTQVSVDERIAQQCRDLKVDFDEIEKFKQKSTHFAEIKYKKTYDEECEFLKKGIQERYKNTFGEYIIPFQKDEETFTEILNRANNKLPPFLNTKDASDKGLKDCLLWLSILKYFKKNGENDVIFVTDDKSAFRNHIDYLSAEFKEVTGKNIEFKPNTFYKELMSTEVGLKEDDEKEKPLPDVTEFRKKINNVIHKLCRVTIEDDWGEEYWEKTFILHRKVDGDYMRVIFEGLRKDIEDNVFKEYISAASIFNLDDRLASTLYLIEMDSIEAAYRLYEEVKEKYPAFREQFYSTAAEIFNNNYVNVLEGINDDDLPF